MNISWTIEHITIVSVTFPNLILLSQVKSDIDVRAMFFEMAYSFFCNKPFTLAFESSKITNWYGLAQIDFIFLGEVELDICEWRQYLEVAHGHDNFTIYKQFKQREE